jgi:hypothetical protein
MPTSNFELFFILRKLDFLMRDEKLLIQISTWAYLIQSFLSVINYFIKRKNII